MITPFNSEVDKTLSELMEEQFLDEYFLLVRRVKGINLSLNDFWHYDMNQIYHLIRNELNIIEEEAKESERQRLESKGMRPLPYEESEEYLDILKEMEV